MNALLLHSPCISRKGEGILETWTRRKLEEACVLADDRLRRRKSALFGHARGVVLEIGAGVGLNHSYLKSADTYVALEPEERFCEHLRKVANRVLHAHAEQIPLSSESVDSITCSMVLCSVSDLNGALEEIQRVLKPGGSLLLIEHVGASRGNWLRFWQRLCRPVCRCLDRGCQPNRDTGQALRSTGLRIAYWEPFEIRLNTPLVRDWIAAKLVKPDSIRAGT